MGCGQGRKTSTWDGAKNCCIYFMIDTDHRLGHKTRKIEIEYSEEESEWESKKDIGNIRGDRRFLQILGSGHRGWKVDFDLVSLSVGMRAIIVMHLR